MVSFQEACKDVLENNVEYRGYDDIGIRRNVNNCIEFFGCFNNKKLKIQCIEFDDLEADWTKIEKEDDWTLADKKRTFEMTSNDYKEDDEKGDRILIIQGWIDSVYVQEFIDKVKEDVKCQLEHSNPKSISESVGQILEKRAGDL